jgi:xanthine dehydrogenase YagS FAD-binding subunit
MQQFQYHRPTTVEQALELFRKNDGAQYIAGGTNLVDLMKKYVATPAHLIDISRLPLDKIVRGEGGITIGALARNNDVAAHPDVRKYFGLLALAIENGASPQLRNMATVGGNLLQRTRCPYFYDVAMPCNKRSPGSGCGALQGTIQRNAAILGTSDTCVATFPSDMSVALAALDATVEVMDKMGKTRRIAFKDFHRLPGTTPDRDNELAPGDLVVSVFVPTPPFDKFQTYFKVRDRSSYAFALVSVAVGLHIEKEVVKDVRIALGGLAHKPWRATAAEAFLVGKTDNEANFKEAAKLVLAEAKALPGNAFKIPLAQNSIVAALSAAIVS